MNLAAFKAIFEALNAQERLLIRLASAERRLEPSVALKVTADLANALRLQRELRLHLETAGRAMALAEPIQQQIAVTLRRIQPLIES